ncbi:MAG: type II secretion system protein [Candidatus Omnitrophota bacterium]
MKKNKLVRSSVFSVRSSVLLRATNYELRTGFTLLEVLLGFAIFTIIMTLVLVTVTGTFKSLHQAEIFMLKEQKQRLCLYHLGRELSSFIRTDFPRMRFEGESVSFFLSMPK